MWISCGKSTFTPGNDRTNMEASIARCLVDVPTSVIVGNTTTYTIHLSIQFVRRLKLQRRLNEVLKGSMQHQRYLIEIVGCLLAMYKNELYVLFV